MKAALNGGLNLSILDGWWDEWFDGRNGWAIPTADGVEDTDRRDDLEAAALYDLIENSVAPAFYTNDDRGLPSRWISMVKHTLETLGPKVLASRMVRQYVEMLYVPAAIAARSAMANGNALATDLSAYKQRVRAAWNGVHVEHVEAEGVADSPMLGTPVTVRAFVSLGELSAEDVTVQVIYGRVDADDRIVKAARLALEPVEQYEGSRWQFARTFNLDRTGAFGYTVRILPKHPALANDAEMGLQALPNELPAPVMGNAIYR